MEDIDVWRTAKILIDAHGDQANLQAAMRSDWCLEDGNPRGVQVWSRIGRAIDELLRRKPFPNEQLN